LSKEAIIASSLDFFLFSFNIAFSLINRVPTSYIVGALIKIDQRYNITTYLNIGISKNGDKSINKTIKVNIDFIVIRIDTDVFGEPCTWTFGYLLFAIFMISFSLYMAVKIETNIVNKTYAIK
jgi:hypothetical protein